MATRQGRADGSTRSRAPVTPDFEPRVSTRGGGPPSSDPQTPLRRSGVSASRPARRPCEDRPPAHTHHVQKQYGVAAPVVGSQGQTDPDLRPSTCPWHGANADRPECRRDVGCVRLTPRPGGTRTQPIARWPEKRRHVPTTDLCKSLHGPSSPRGPGRDADSRGARRPTPTPGPKLRAEQLA